jgi:SAM-dependent methyltransferase
MKRLKTYQKFFESVGSPLLDLSNNVDHHLISVIQKETKTPSKVLEISCGNGSDSLKLQELGYEVTCTEYNTDYVKNAQDLGLDCIQHDTKNKFPFSDKEFDLIYSRLGLHYFTEEELNSIFSELQRIGKKILITVKVVDDIKTGKVILTEEKWKEIVNRFFNIKSFEVKEGQLYGSQSKWIEIGGESLEKTFEARVYQLSLVDGRSEIQEDMELMKDMLSDIEDFEDLGVHIKNWLDYID